ncbi:MAG: endonuclease/exonuclease/phosphatase family protein [Geminicoccaceae bacterium]
MSLNAWGGRLADALLPYLAAVRPDVLCLQEVTCTPGAAGDWLVYRDGELALPQRANLLDEVGTVLPEHAAMFCPAAQGALWDGAVPLASRFGLATFVHRDLAVIGQAQGFVHGRYAADGYGPHPRPRNAHVVRLHDPRTGVPVTVAQLHGLRDPVAGKRDTPERLAQAQRLKALVEAVAQPGDRLVVCGDFNVEPDSATFEILGTLGLRDLVTGRGHAGTRTSHYAKPGKFADYMLVGADLAEAPFEVVRAPEVSDHCPLLLSLG